MTTHRIVLLLTWIAGASLAPAALAQERGLEAGVHGVWLDQSELDAGDPGFGGRLGYRLGRHVALEGELNLFPRDVPDDVPITSSRLEGLFGVRAGPRFDRVAIFGKLRPGFVRFGEAPEPVACIAIFPPPLSCVIAAGTTVLALDVGGGAEVSLSEHSVLRADLSAAMLRFEAPVLTRVGEALTDGAFWSRQLRLSLGVGWRF